MKGKSLSHVRLLATPWTAAYQAPLSTEFSRQEYWSRLPWLPLGEGYSSRDPGHIKHPSIQGSNLFFDGINIFSSISFQLLENDHLSSLSSVQFSSVVSNSVNPWTAACQASLSITNSWSLLRLMSIESVMPSNHVILCCPLLLLPSIFPSIRVFSNESVLCIRWPKYCSFSFSISLSSEYSGLISFRME